MQQLPVLREQCQRGGSDCLSYRTAASLHLEDAAVEVVVKGEEGTNKIKMLNP